MALPVPIDVLVMNAGGTGGKSPTALTASGATYLFAVNVLGHTVLLETLISEQKLTEVAIFAGSEAVRGVPKLRIPRPRFESNSTDELASVIDGSYFLNHRFTASLGYAQAKYIGALWMAAEARLHPELRLVTISPGSTTDTGAAQDMAAVQRFAYNKLLMGLIAPVLHLAHPLSTGAARHVATITDPSYRSGVFYASKANTLTGPVIDQAEIFPDLGNREYQEHAASAIHRFTT